MSTLTNDVNEKPNFPALDKFIYKHRVAFLQDFVPFLSMAYGIGLLASSGPSLSTILEAYGGMSLELSAVIFVLAGAVRFGRPPGTVPPIIHALTFFPWMVYTFMAVWSALINGSTWGVIVMYGGILTLDIVQLIISLYSKEGA